MPIYKSTSKNRKNIDNIWYFHIIRVFLLFIGMIVLEKHLNAQSVWSFADTNIPHPEELLWSKYYQIIDDVLNFPRSGWIKRGIPHEVAETVSGHCAKVAIATKLYITSQQVEIILNNQERERERERDCPYRRTPRFSGVEHKRLHTGRYKKRPDYRGMKKNRGIPVYSAF